MINTVFGKETRVIKFSVIAPNATYDLVRNVPGVNEGSSFNITLNTTGVQNGQSIPYTITGIQQADINEPLTGSFVVQNGQANKVFNVVADSLTEGVEVFKMTLDGVGSNVSVTVNDTSSTPGDPYWSNVVLLMHMDGTDGGTVFTDDIGHLVTREGAPYTSTAVKRFGTSSGRFGGSADRLSLTSSNFTFSANAPLTVEGWFNVYGGSGTTRVLVDTRNTNYRDGMAVMIRTTGQLRVVFLDSEGKLTSIDDPVSISTNTWYHFAVVRSAGTLYLFKDGVIVGTNTNAHALDSNTLRVGLDQSGANPFTGYIDELRITNGVARYAANFTPPTAPFLNA